MPRMMPKMCDRPMCNELVPGGVRYCDKHRKDDFRLRTKLKRERDPKSISFYNSPEWRRVRLAHLKREPFCRECKISGQDTFAEMVDHILPIQQGGARFDPQNLQSLCNRCHDRKRQKESMAVRVKNDL